MVDGSSCYQLFGCRGYEIEEATTTLADMFSAINLFRIARMGFGCADVREPGCDFVIVDVAEDETLSFGGDIWYEPEHGDEVRLFHDQFTLPVDEPMPAYHMLEGSSGYGTFQLRVLIEEVEESTWNCTNKKSDIRLLASLFSPVIFSMKDYTGCEVV